MTRLFAIAALAVGLVGCNEDGPDCRQPTVGERASWHALYNERNDAINGMAIRYLTSLALDDCKIEWTGGPLD